MEFDLVNINDFIEEATSFGSHIEEYNCMNYGYLWNILRIIIEVEQSKFRAFGEIG